MAHSFTFPDLCLVYIKCKGFHHTFYIYSARIRNDIFSQQKLFFLKSVIVFLVEWSALYNATISINVKPTYMLSQTCTTNGWTSPHYLQPSFYLSLSLSLSLKHTHTHTSIYSHIIILYLSLSLLHTHILSSNIYKKKWNNKGLYKKYLLCTQPVWSFFHMN